MKRKSLMKSILSSSIGMLVCVVVVVSSIFSTLVNYRYFVSVKQDFYHTVSAESNEMSEWITKHITIAENLALSAVTEDLRGDSLKNYLQQCVINTSDSIMDCYLAWEDEAPSLKAAYFEPTDDFVPQDRGWYKQAVSTGSAIITDPYIDYYTGKIVITIATPIISDGKTLGVCGMDIDITELVDLTNNIRLDQNGYAVLVDSSDNVVIHTGSADWSHHLDGEDEKVTALTDISPRFADVIASAATGETCQYNDYDGKKRFFSAVALGDIGWKVIYAADYAENFSVIVSNIIILLLLAFAGMIAGIAFISVKFKKRLSPMPQIEKIVGDMANGMLDHTYPEIRVNDEIGAIVSTLETTNSSLKNYISEIERRLSAMADGDFTAKSEVEFIGEFTAIGESLDAIQESLIGTFSQIDAAADQISDGSRGVASGATELANAVSDATTLISEVTASVEDVSEKVNKSAENASSAKDAAFAAAGVVSESNSRMNELLKAMNDIAASAEEIVSINATIEDIAFQTNILALNASIEAARAGEAGKGFAVVADEVRNLANKSGDASNTTRRLIGETVEVIGRGKELANETAELLSNAAERAVIIEDSVTEISDVSEKQKAQLSEVVDKLNSVTGVVQTTAATAEESAAASEELDGQVDMLRTTLSKFKIK